MDNGSTHNSTTCRHEAFSIFASRQQRWQFFVAQMLAVLFQVDEGSWFHSFVCFLNRSGHVRKGWHTSWIKLTNIWFKWVETETMMAMNLPKKTNLWNVLHLCLWLFFFICFIIIELPKKQIYEIYYIYIYVFLFVYYVALRFYFHIHIFFCHLFLYIIHIQLKYDIIYKHMWNLLVFYLGGWALQTKSFSNQNKGHVDSTPRWIICVYI